MGAHNTAWIFRCSHLTGYKVSRPNHLLILHSWSSVMPDPKPPHTHTDDFKNNVKATSETKPSHVCSAPFWKFSRCRETESDPTVLLNSTHSLLARPRLSEKPQKLALGVFGTSAERSQGWSIQMKQLAVWFFLPHWGKHEAKFNLI